MSISQWFLLLFFISAPALAEECGWNSDYSFWSCEGSFAKSTAGTSGPMLGDLLSDNPAAIPSSPTPFGLEGTFSDRSSPSGKAKVAVSTVKGFEGIGFGIGSWTDGTFTAPDLPPHFLSSEKYAEFQEYQLNPPASLGLRLGSSFALPKRTLGKGMRLSFGGSAGFGRTKGDWAPQVGALLQIRGFGIGFSESFEKIAASLPSIRVSNLSVGMPLGNLYLGYSYLIVSSRVNRTSANVIALRWANLRWSTYANLKLQKDHRGSPDAWTRLGIQRRIGKHLGLGYDYGLYRYAHSLLLQLFL